jgi:hypothetical protein
MAFVAAPVYYRAGEAGAASRSVNLLIFHDREDFCVLFHIKVFAIMKFSLLCSD